MQRYVGLLIAILLLGYGLVRMGVGGALLAQTLALVSFPDLAEGVSEVRIFFDARVNNLIVPFSLVGYFSYIMAMGMLLAAGAIGAIKQRHWGFALLVIYWVMHAALFINAKEINPKLWGLALQAAMLLGLYYLRPPRQAGSI